MKRFSICAACVVCLAAFAVSFAMAQEKAPAQDGWINLFEGKTLADFDCYLDDNGVKENVYTLEDGILKVSGNPYGWLSPKGTYRNFIFETEIFYPTDDPKANSGIFIRIAEPENRPTPLFLPPCVECQLQTQNIGHLFAFHGHTLIGASDRYSYRERKEFDGKAAPELHKLLHVKNAQVGADGWNKLAIFCHEDLVTVFLNGQAVNWACNVTNAAGRIGFQSEGGQVWFRNARIKPMDEK